MLDKRLGFKEYRVSKEELNNAILFYRRILDDSSLEVEVIHDKERQLKGQDVILHLGSKQQIRIEEKSRKEDYNDIGLEICHTALDGSWTKEGWLAESYDTDYIVYVIKPTQRIFIIPYKTLRKVFKQNKEKWVKEYNQYPSFKGNKGYVTWNVGVPTKILKKAIEEIDNQN